LDLKEIRQIIEMMKRSELTRFEIEESGLRLKICRDIAQQASAITHTWAPQAYAPQLPAGYPAPAQHPAHTNGGANGSAASSNEDEGPVDYITSPMVGTFYRAPSPDSTPYADVDTQVNENSVVCIIEAMKVMNEISSEKEGRIIEVLVSNGEAVEYGQKLFKIRPN
jgi:acetyl-CoA carboxylase biotin carboxyl carrier protein